MTPTIEKLLSPGEGASRSSADVPVAADRIQSPTRIVVVFTSIDETLAALREAGAMTRLFDTEITVVIPQVVSDPFPLSSPPTLVNVTEEQLRTIERESRARTRIVVYLCRDRFDLLSTVIHPEALIFIGGQRRWWPTPEKRLARKLRRANYEVAYIETE